MKNVELYSVKVGLMLLDGTEGVKLGALRAELNRDVKPLISDLEEFKNSAIWKETDALLEEVNKKYYLRDKDGRQVVVNNIPLFKNELERDEEINALEKSKKDLFTKRKKMMEEYKEELEKDCKKTFPKIPFSLFPKNTKTEVIDLLWSVIDSKK